MFLVLPCLRVSVPHTHTQRCVVCSSTAKSHLHAVRERIMWRRSRSDVSWCSGSLNVLGLSAEPCPFIAALAVEDRGWGGGGGAFSAASRGSLSGTAGLLDDFHWAKQCQSETNVCVTSWALPINCSVPPPPLLHGKITAESIYTIMPLCQNELLPITWRKTLINFHQIMLFWNHRNPAGLMHLLLCNMCGCRWCNSAPCRGKTCNCNTQIQPCRLREPDGL